MNCLLRFIRKSLCHGLICSVYFSFFVTASFGAELLPFPTRDRAPQYQQSSPRYREPIPPSKLEQFRRDIAGFSCPDLKALHSRLRSQYKAAKTEADRNYYWRFLNELNRELDHQNCNE